MTKMLKQNNALTLQKVIVSASNLLNTPNSLHEAKLLLAFVLAIPVNKMFFHEQKILSKKELDAFSQLITRRSKYEPISHIIAKRNFWNSEFIVNANVLDPRPDTETMIECILKEFTNLEQKLNILDLGTGTGCILLSLLEIYKNSTGLGIDVSDQALSVAIKNAEKLHLKNRTEFLENNWHENINKKFDIIVSNPPYIPTKTIETLQIEVRYYEPKLALDGGNDGLNCYKQIAINIEEKLKNNGKLFLEIGQGQERDVQKIFEQQELKFLYYKKDLNGIVRVLVFKK